MFSLIFLQISQCQSYGRLWTSLSFVGIYRSQQNSVKIPNRKQTTAAFWDSHQNQSQRGKKDLCWWKQVLMGQLNLTFFFYPNSADSPGFSLQLEGVDLLGNNSRDNNCNSQPWCVSFLIIAQGFSVVPLLAPSHVCPNTCLYPFLKTNLCPQPR